MNLNQLSALLADPDALQKRGREAAMRSARSTAENELRASTQELLNGATVTTERIRAACDAIDAIKKMDLDF